MQTSDFDFDLPEELIALEPVTPRDAARLLVVDPQGAPLLADRHVRDLPNLLRRGDVLVVNDTRVIPAALVGVRIRGEHQTSIALNLLRRISPSRWRALARPARRLAPGDRLRFERRSERAPYFSGELEATLAARLDGGEVEIDFDLSGPALDNAIAAVGEMPLPPYIAARRPADARDRESYQTLFAARDGAVAAPTAALHFTPALLAALEAAGIERQTVTLHVGAGTFLPVKVEDPRDHVMHAEWGEMTAETAAALNSARGQGRRIVAVGTTPLRLLETATDERGCIQPFSAETSIFITPGYRFRAVDVLMTNFHLPRSTLMMLVAAFCGLETIKAAYAHAIRERYRFYSYGDACLLHRAAASDP